MLPHSLLAFPAEKREDDDWKTNSIIASGTEREGFHSMLDVGWQKTKQKNINPCFVIRQKNGGIDHPIWHPKKHLPPFFSSSDHDDNPSPRCMTTETKFLAAIIFLSFSERHKK